MMSNLAEMTNVGESETPVVSLNNVSVRYPSGHIALAGVSLTLNRGEFAFLVGPSGAGKSSLVGLLVRDVLPFAGEVHVAGYSVRPSSE